MLTAFQCEVIAFVGEGETVCRDCAVTALENEGGEAVADLHPVIRYSLDEYQSEMSYDEGTCPATGEEYPEDPADRCGCASAILCDRCYEEILEAWTDDYAHTTRAGAYLRAATQVQGS